MSSPTAFVFGSGKWTSVRSMKAFPFVAFNPVDEKHFSAAVNMKLAWIPGLPGQVFNRFAYNFQ
jgi:hypothetical protein